MKNLDFVNTEIGALTAEIAKQHLTASTTIILSAKHGQSPTDPAALTRVADGPLLDGLNAAWKKLHPGAPDLVTHAVDDDAMLLWPLRPLRGRHRLRQEVPARAERHRHRHQRQAQGLHPERAQQGPAPARPPPTTSTSRPETPASRTSSESRSTASSTPAAPRRSPSTAAATPTTSRYPSSSPVPPSRPAA
ncbi:hypothetical protein ACRAWF_41245 [Streptomyces sp. L7]